jgi:four helix bundle protein
MPALDHERLEVYQVARDLSREICRVQKRIKPGRADLVDQLRRATASVPLSIAEGNGERMQRRRAYFFRIARSSATEVASVLDHLVDMELLNSDEIDAAKALVVRIVSMLVKLTIRIGAGDDDYVPTAGRRRRGRI